MSGWRNKSSLSPLPQRRASFFWLLASGSWLLPFLLSACAKRDSPAPAAATGPAPQILRISQRNEPADLDPVTATLPDEFYIIGALGEGLLVPNPAYGPPLSGVAEHYDVSADGLTYTFHLRPTAVWSNGDPLTADDFLASYRRALTPATAAPKADLFFAVKNARAFTSGALADFSAVGFRAPDPHTFVITLEHPSARFPYYVASGPWIPVHLRTVVQHGRKWTEPAHHIGNGAFTLADWRPQQRIVVKKNLRFRNAARVHLDEIHFVRFDSGDSEERAFRAGQVDVTVAVPATKIAVYARERPTELHRAPTSETRFLTFNTRRSALADARVRLALALAIDRPQIVERVTLGGQEPAWRLLPPLLRDPSSAPFLSPQRDDTSTARQLLVDAGFANGKNFPRLELTAWSPSQTPVLEALQSMWREQLGLDVAISIREAKVHLAALAAGDYDIAFVTTYAILDVDDPAALLAAFATGAPHNFPGWSDPAFDHLVSTALVAPDTTAQTAPLAAAESRLLSAAPIAPLYFNTRSWLMSPRVHGWQHDALWTRNYLNLRIAPEK